MKNWIAALCIACSFLPLQAQKAEPDFKKIGEILSKFHYPKALATPTRTAKVDNGNFYLEAESFYLDYEIPMKDLGVSVDVSKKLVRFYCLSGSECIKVLAKDQQLDDFSLEGTPAVTAAEMGTLKREFDALISKYGSGNPGLEMTAFDFGSLNPENEGSPKDEDAEKTDGRFDFSGVSRDSDELYFSDNKAEEPKAQGTVDFDKINRLLSLTRTQGSVVVSPIKKTASVRDGYFYLNAESIYSDYKISLNEMNVTIDVQKHLIKFFCKSSGKCIQSGSSQYDEVTFEGMGSSSGLSDWKDLEGQFLLLLGNDKSRVKLGTIGAPKPSPSTSSTSPSTKPSTPSSSNPSPSSSNYISSSASGLSKGYSGRTGALISDLVDLADRIRSKRESAAGHLNMVGKAIDMHHWGSYQSNFEFYGSDMLNLRAYVVEFGKKLDELVGRSDLAAADQSKLDAERREMLGFYEKVNNVISFTPGRTRIESMQNWNQAIDEYNRVVNLHPW